MPDRIPLKKIRITAELPVGDTEDLVLLELAQRDSLAPIMIGPVKRGMLVTFYTENSATTRNLEDLYA